MRCGRGATPSGLLGRRAEHEAVEQVLTRARPVATGATSREVAVEPFLSPRTVQAHLRSVFRELGITSRRQLRDVICSRSLPWPVAPR
jgi:DNA-binding NarL/FixJ family response regulator